MIEYMVKQSEDDVQILSSMSIMSLRLKHQQNYTLVKSKAAQFEEETQRAKAQQEEELKLQEQRAKKEIKVGNYRTVPCKNFHGPAGCSRGDFCHFIHVVQFERNPLPREVFKQYRNENMRNNMLAAIKEVNP